MKKNIYVAFLVCLLFSAKAFSSDKVWVALNESNPVKCKPVITASSSSLTEVEYKLPGFFLEEKKTPQGNAYSVTVPGGAKMLEAGMPDLPQLAFSVIIPDNAEMKAEVVSSSYTDYHYSIAPSKGNLKRDKDPSEVPFSYSSNYSVNSFFPGAQTLLRSPYIIRDFRGQAVVVYPFQYNPVTQTLRVYHTMKIKVSPKGNSGSSNVYYRQHPVSAVDASFASIYRTHFVNANIFNYTPLYEHGNMLVIADASLMATMQPFVDWKNRMGQHTEMVDIASIGANPTDIKTYIENYYNTNGLTFVLLVGDGPQIPPYPSQYGDSDPSYGYILGSDSYAEVFVGRFSANDPSELETQVQRTLNYEMHPDPNGQWYHKGVCIGSDQGPGDDNEMDFEHERNIRTDFMGYTYTDVDELYDGTQGFADSAGNPTAADLNLALNDGRSVVTYTGHGSSVSLGTTGYSASDVSALTNFDELPFIWSVACVNGDFNSGTCLAEAFMRSTSSAGKATGAIATLMSTINQSWDPPMDGQDEMVDILVESYLGNIKHTFGGISVNGCMHMNDQYGTGGDEMTDTWTCFGDPSLMVRTNTPVALNVTNATTIDVNASSYVVGCAQSGALVCLSHHNQINCTSWTILGSATLNPTALAVGDTLDLVVTAYNAIPYFAQVVVTSSPTGITPIASKAYSLFPNPTKGIVSLDMPVSAGKISLRVVNAIGQTEMIAPCQNGKADLTSLSAGVYSVLIYNDQELFGVEKVVIE